MFFISSFEKKQPAMWNGLHTLRAAHSLRVSDCKNNRSTANVENLPPKKKKIPVRYSVVKQRHRVMFWTVAKKQRQLWIELRLWRHVLRVDFALVKVETKRRSASALRELLFCEPDKVYFFVRYLAVEGRCGCLLTVPCCLCSTTCRRCCCRSLSAPAGKSCLPVFNDRVQASSLKKSSVAGDVCAIFFCLYFGLLFV